MKQPLTQKPSFVIACCALIVLISMGTRQSFGLFLRPMKEHLGVGREVYSLAIALQNLIFGLPLVAIVADRVGPRPVAIGGGLVYAFSVFLLSSLTTGLGLYLNLGLLVGIALSSTSFVVVVGVAAKVVPAERRSSVFGLITAAGSFGMFAVVQGMKECFRDSVGKLLFSHPQPWSR